MSWIASAVPKQICRFLLNRYLGEILLEKVNVEQLSVDLINGTGSISDVYLDVQHINEALLRSELPFELIEGFIGNIKVQIPYSKLLNDSCNVELSGLELTLQPKPKCQTTDLMSSMIESVIVSMTTSIDLARSFVEEQQNFEGTTASTLDQQLNGIDALAQLIQIILSRMKINFSNTIVRLETLDACQNSGLGLEAQIDRIEFVDECVDAQVPSGAPVTEQPQPQNFAGNGAQSGGDLSKLVRLYGVRFFTDLFDKPESGSMFRSLVVRRKLSEVSQQAPVTPCSTKSIYKSCYHDVDHSKGADHLSGDPCSSTTSSMHSEISSSSPDIDRLTENARKSQRPNGGRRPEVEALPTTLRSNLRLDTSKASFEQKNLHNWSKPLQFAHFASEKLTIRIRLKNGLGDTEFKREEVDVEMFLGSLNVFLTPTQLYLLYETAKSLFSPDVSTADMEQCKGSKPMKDDDFFKVEMDLRRKVEEPKLPTSFFTGNAFSGGNWSGNDKFYRSSKTPWKSKGQPGEEDEFISIPMSFVGENLANDFVLTNDDYKPAGTNICSASKRTSSCGSGQKNSAAPLISHFESTKPDCSRCKICLSNFLLCLTHDDPFSGNSASKAMAVVSSWAEKFFETTDKISLAAMTDTKTCQKMHNNACDVDHMRLVASPLVTEWVRTSFGSVQISMSANKTALLECLYSEMRQKSVNKKDASLEPEIIQLIKFEHNDEHSSQNPDVKINLSTDDQLAYACSIQLNECHVNVDVTLLDRLHNLIFCRNQMPFKSGSQPKLVCNALLDKFLFEVPDYDVINNVGVLNDLWLEPLHEKPDADRPDCTLDVFCPGFLIFLSFPIPDMRPIELIDRSPWWIRQVRGDHLALFLDNAQFKTKICHENSIAKMGNFFVTFSNATVSFFEDELKKTHKILHASCNEEGPCCFEFKWDFINRSLSMDQNNSESDAFSLSKYPGSGINSKENLLVSLERNCFKLSPSFDGPFLKKHVAHENEQLTIVGSKQEIRDFRKQCLSHCSMGINLKLNCVRLFLPEKRVYELLYNRLVNDLALWSPSNPSFQSHFNRLDFGASLFESCNAWLGSAYNTENFVPCKPYHKADDSDSGSDSATIKSASGHALPQQANKRKGAPHKFSALLQCGSADVMLCMPAYEDTNEMELNGSTNLRLIGQNLEAFLVYGYDNDVNVSYFYVTSETATLKNSVAPCPTPTNIDVNFDNFASNFDWLVMAEATPPNLALKTEADDNFSLAVRFTLQPVENVKEFLITFGIRNSTVHFRPDNKTTAENFWIFQLVKFFDMVDYPVVGFNAPKVINDIHVHAWNLVFQFKPENLPYILRCHVDSLDVSTNIVQEASMFRFHVIVEDLSIFLARNSQKNDQTTKNGENTAPPGLKPEFAASSAANFLTDYVCLVKMGFFELNLVNYEPPPETSDVFFKNSKKRTKPLQEIQIRNDLLEIKACVDSLVALSSVLKHLAAGFEKNSDFDNLPTAEEFDNCSTEDAPTNHQPGDDDQTLKDMMKSAMQDIAASTSTQQLLHKQLQQQKRTAQARNQRTMSASMSKRVLPRATPLDSNLSAANRTMTRSVHYKPINPSRQQSEGIPSKLTNVDAVKEELPHSSSRIDKNRRPDIASISKNTPAADHRVPSIRHLDAGDQSVTLIDNHFNAPLQKTDVFTKSPTDYPIPLLQYLLKDFTISCCVYGGRDFGASNEPKIYSGMNVAQQTPILRQRINEARRNPFTCGGKGRDHTVAVELCLNKLCCLHELYPPDCPQIARQVVTVQEVQIKDHLLVSTINKLLYLYSTEERPKPTYTPMFCLKLLQFSSNPFAEQPDEECNLKISLLPLRLHVDQDTLQFLVDFSKEFHELANKNACSREKRQRSTSNSLPVICVTKSPEKLSNHVNHVENQRRELPLFELEPNGRNFASKKSIESNFRTNLTIDSDSESDLDSDSGNLKFGVKLGEDENQLIHTKTGATSKKSVLPDQPTKKPAVSRSRTISNCSNKSDSDNSGRRLSSGDGIYIKSFIFSPAVDIKLDYCGKHLQMDQQGTLSSLLFGLSQLHSAKIRLKQLHYRHGLLGFDRATSYAFNEWLTDIRRNQMYSIVGGVGPVNTVLQVSQGFIDLFWLPVDQYRKDGHVVKGIQRGAQSFGVSTASAALELSQRLVGAVQSVAEFAFDIVNPEYPPKPNDLLQGLARPYDFREGVHMACASVYRGLHETAEAITLATQEERARGHWAIRGVLRQATPTIIRPLVVASRATTHILGGLRNQLKPDTWREEKNKWKDE